ncbi:hypothetical protein [Geoalkalibacter sp.]|uniref:hypothetical protein n=1 Tax=Geoalkalibacter sp. TaxID=3041440 RepID=UPI00272EC559|nr:hypothetical protein [Geoalkalibacter sp.]
MRGEERINVCQAVMHGSSRILKNVRKHEEGRVLKCDDRGFEVEVGARQERWPFDDVEIKEH